MGFELVIEDDENNTLFQIEQPPATKTKKAKGKMVAVLKHLTNGKLFQLTQGFTKIGKENCDINIVSPLVELRHAVVEYDDKAQCYVIEDLNTPHGTYVNDCRVQNAKVRIAHGDIIRLGHGGPQLEVLLEVQPHPPIVMQHVWEDSHGKQTNLPYLPVQSAPVGEIKQYSSKSYGRNNGYHGHNKTVLDDAMIPHPPVRQRPLSANPSNGVFLANKPGSFTKDYSLSGAKPSDQVMDLEAKLLRMEDELSRLAAYEAECFRKDNVIISLRNEVEKLQSKENSIAEENMRMLASLQNQVSFKNEEIQRLEEENHRLQLIQHHNSTTNTHQIAEMKTLLARHDQNISVMENEMKKSNQEKIQLTKLVTTLQKEVSAKDSLLKKSKSETEKYRLDCRNKEMEISSLIAKIQKQTLNDKVKQDLKKKDEEISSIKYRMKKADEKVNNRDATIDNLRDQLSAANGQIENLEKSLKIMEQDNTHYRSKCMYMENTEQSQKIEFENLEMRYDRLIQQIQQLASEEDDETIQNESQAVTFIHKLRKNRDQAISDMEQALNEKARVENGMISEDSIHSLRSHFYDIESRLSRNGRTCVNLRNELGIVQDLQISERLQWVKEFFVSMLTQEYKWEQQIEDALDTVKAHETDDCGIEPTTLIHRLHIKLKDNLQKLDELENKISMSEEEQSKIYKDAKKELKEKYKKKMEKAIEEVKANELKRYEQKLNDHNDKLALELKTKEQQLRVALQRYELDNDNANELKQKINKLENDIVGEQIAKKRLENDLEKSKQVEEFLEEKLKQKDEEMLIQTELMERKFKSYENAEQNIMKGKTKELQLTISSLESTLLDINKEKKELENKLQKMKAVIKEQQSRRKKKERDDEEYCTDLQQNIEKLKLENEVQKHKTKAAEKDCEEQKEIVQTLRRDLEGLSARLTDLKGELQDEEKRKMEELQEKLEQQEFDHLEQRKQLIQLSALVEEQKKKLLEQDQLLKRQSDTLAYQADGLMEHSKEMKKKAMVKKLDRSPQEIRMIGQRCIGKQHDQVIAKQKMAISEIRDSINTMDSRPNAAPKTTKSRSSKKNKTM